MKRIITHMLLGLSVAGAMAAASVAAMAADIVKVHMPPPSMESMAFYNANALGYYREEGIEFQPQILATDVGVMATVAGNVDATQILGLSLRGAIEHGFDLKIAMIFNRLPGYSLVLNKSIASIKDLKGKKIASTSSGASATKTLKTRLAESGLNPEKDVSFFYIGKIPTIYQAVTGGTVDAGVLLSPFDILATKAGYKAMALTDQPGILTGGIALSGKFMRERPDVVKRFMHATWRGLRTLKDNRDGTIAVMAKAMKIAPAMAAEIYDKWIDRYSATGFEDDAFLDKVLTFEFGQTSAERRAKAFDFSLVRSFTK
jgi:NitT/TauT family transport system substrate-binding protein